MSAQRRQVIVVGGGAAGDGAVESLRRAGFDGGIVLVGAERNPVTYRPYLSKEFIRGEVPEEKVLLRGADPYEGMDVEWLHGRRAVEGSLRDRSVTLDDGRQVPFDSLVLATGGLPRSLPGVPPATNVFTLRTLDDCVALREALAGGGRLLVIGAGFIGAEVAASMRARGMAVLLVEVAPVPLARALGEDMGRIYAQVHRDHGVDLRTGASVAEWHLEGDLVRAVGLADGTREEVQAVLVAVGIRPELSLAERLGLPLASGGVWVDAALQAEPGVYCAGDMAAHLHPLYGRHLRVEHWQVARKQGQAVGRAIAGRPEPVEELPWFWSDQYDLKLQYLGHAAGFDRAVWRGRVEDGRYSIFYLNGGVVDAVLAVNEARSVRFARELIQRRARVHPDLLGSESVDLKELARS
jgi:3-phenylpropionate/trans-cinnamate dioxygenase ferredoxin reductase component